MNERDDAGPDEEIVICLGFPGMQRPDQMERLRALSPRIRVTALAIDPDGIDAMSDANQAIPVDEPPPWGREVADERRRVLSEMNVFIALHTPADLDVLAPRLRWVQGVGAGIEQFAAAGVRRGRTIATTASGTSSASMAEFVLGRLLQIWKRFREIEEHQKQRRYERTYGRTFRGTTVGIVGFGNIGQAVARAVNGLGAQSLALRRSEPSDEERALAQAFYKPEQLHELLGSCDVAVVCAPATPATERLIDTKAIAAMRDGAVLVNVARGSLVDEAAVIEALESGKLGAAVLDVFDEEPLPANDPLWNAPNLYASGHCSVSVDRYLDDVFDLFEDNVARWLAGNTLRNQVDMAALGFQAEDG